MKKLYFCLLSPFAATSLLAAFIETSDTVNNNSGTPISGYFISGAGSASELANNPYNWAVIDGSTINFDSVESGNFQVTGSPAKLAWGDYSLGTKGNSVLNFKSGSNYGIVSKSGICTSYGADAQKGGNLIINVEDGYNGTIQVPVFGAFMGSLTLNINKANAFTSGTSTDVRLATTSSLYLNMTADNAFQWDIRGKTNLNVNISNGANLIFSSVNGYALSSTSQVNVKITSDALDGFICFAESIVDSVDTENTLITLIGENIHTIYKQTVSFVGSDGSPMEDLTLGQKEIDGVSYYYVTGLQIPEPAGYATILGAAVIALAFLRKRK